MIVTYQGTRNTVHINAILQLYLHEHWIWIQFLYSCEFPKDWVKRGMNIFHKADVLLLKFAFVLIFNFFIDEDSSPNTRYTPCYITSTRRNTTQRLRLPSIYIRTIGNMLWGRQAKRGCANTIRKNKRRDLPSSSLLTPEILTSMCIQAFRKVKMFQRMVGFWNFS